MPKATKKIVKRVTKKTIPVEIADTPVVSTSLQAPINKKRMNSKFLGLALIVIVLGLITYKAGPWLVPSLVDNRPVTRFELWSRLEKSYGAQALDDMINEKILDKTIADAHIKIEQTKLDAQLKALETQFEPTGGLDEALKQRGLSRKDLTKQISTQLAVEELLADKIIPAEEDVKKQFDDGATTVY